MLTQDFKMPNWINQEATHKWIKTLLKATSMWNSYKEISWLFKILLKNTMSNIYNAQRSYVNYFNTHQMAAPIGVFVYACSFNHKKTIC